MAKAKKKTAPKAKKAKSVTRNGIKFTDTIPGRTIVKAARK